VWNAESLLAEAKSVVSHATEVVFAHEEEKQAPFTHALFTAWLRSAHRHLFLFLLCAT